MLEFTSPVDKWIQNLFNISNDTMDGQQTTREVLTQIKEYFNV
jgi:DNA polymerase III alpha subunit (gram-positive type)